MQIVHIKKETGLLIPVEVKNGRMIFFISDLPFNNKKSGF